MFHYSREVPDGWQADLESLIPRGTQVPWLKIVWQPGLSPKDTNRTDLQVQRWEVYEVVPGAPISEDILAELKGPDPRTLGEFRPDPDHKDREGWLYWESWCNISRTQWDIFQETKFWSQRFWIIQGSFGGHVWTLSRTEKSFLKAMGMVYDTPLPGDLPYAEYTHRTAAKMAELDRLRKWRKSMDWNARTATVSEAGLWVMRDRATEEVEWNERMMRHLMNEIEEVVSDMPRTVVNEMMTGNNAAPRGLFDKGFDTDDLDRRVDGSYERELEKQMKGL